MVALVLGSGERVWGHETAGAARYLGNEGVLVTLGDVKVLFDAFYADSYGSYVLVSESDREKLMNDKPPFDGIDAIFVSHAHGDHFTAAPTLAYLRLHPDVRLFGSWQVADSLAAATNSDDPVLKRIVPFELQPGDTPEVVQIENLLIDVFAIPHVGGARMAAVSNLVFRVTLDGLSTVMHLGDSEIDNVLFAALQLHWDARHTHVAFSPYWFIGNEAGERILTDNLKADQVIGIHVPAESVGNGDGWRNRLGGDLFTDPGESRAVGHGHVRGGAR
ncbi:MAG: MBL fold metallo-hydrolase [Gammaproteobacteria bacterium]|nr:MBL fold metallo-hydrolase [Gammaproteobacteria bacterium]